MCTFCWFGVVSLLSTVHGKNSIKYRNTKNWRQQGTLDCGIRARWLVAAGHAGLWQQATLDCGIRARWLVAAGQYYFFFFFCYTMDPKNH
jgi:hypothetical protein